eukprot:scaffold118992_cov36-Prasinocladus_malaysianus.AAC.4
MLDHYYQNNRANHAISPSQPLCARLRPCYNFKARLPRAPKNKDGIHHAAHLLRYERRPSGPPVSCPAKAGPL